MRKKLFCLLILLFGTILFAEELTISDYLRISTKTDINNIEYENILYAKIHGIITNNNTTILYAAISGEDIYEICVNKGVSFFYMTDSEDVFFDYKIYRCYNVYQATVIDVKDNAIEIVLKNTDKLLGFSGLDKKIIEKNIVNKQMIIN